MTLLLQKSVDNKINANNEIGMNKLQSIPNARQFIKQFFRIQLVTASMAFTRVTNETKVVAAYTVLYCRYSWSKPNPFPDRMAYNDDMWGMFTNCAHPILPS